MNTYPSYKDSGVEWIGDIPSGWSSSKFKYISNLFTGNSLNQNQKEQYESDDTSHISYVSSKDINVEYQTVNYNNGLRIPPTDNTLKVCKTKGFLLCVEGGSSGRKMTFLNEDVCFVNKLCCFESSQNTKYQYYFVQTSHFQSKFKISLTGLIGGVSISTLRNFEVPLPPLQEQQQISDYLDYKTSKIDTLLEKTRQKIELLKEQRISLINTTVTRGLNPNVEMKDSGVEWIGKIPSGWEVVKLKFVGNVVIGLSYSPDNVVDEGEGTLVMRSTNVQNGKPSFHDNVYVDKDIPDRMVTREGDILICSRNGSRNLIGKNCIISKDIEGMTFGVFMTIFRSKYWKLIYWVLNSSVFKSQSGLYLTSTINQLTVSTIKNLSIPFTFNESEQQQIVDYLDKETSKIDKLVDIESKRIILLKEYRQSLISDVVTGKVDVRDEILV
jgi:type I restriction enzyme S subunit